MFCINLVTQSTLLVILSLGLKDQLEGEYECTQYTQVHTGTQVHRYTQVHTSHSNDWHYVTISKRNENVFTWKNKAGVEWHLTLDGEESGGEVKFKVGGNS